MLKIISIIFCSWLMVGCVTNTHKMPSDEINTVYNAANEAYDEKNYQLALSEYLKLTKNIGADAIIWFRIGNSYNYLENYDEAVQAYEKSVSLDPRLSKAWHNMGVLQLKMSVNTWRQMLVYISKDDPLYERAIDISQKLLEVVDEE